MTDKYTHSNPFPHHTSRTQSTPRACPLSQSKRVGMWWLTASLKKKIKTSSLLLLDTFFFFFFCQREREREINLLRDQNICWRRNLGGCWQLALWRENSSVNHHSLSRSTGKGAQESGQCSIWQMPGSHSHRQGNCQLCSAWLPWTTGWEPAAFCTWLWNLQVSSVLSRGVPSREPVEVVTKTFMPQSKSLLRTQFPSWK